MARIPYDFTPFPRKLHPGWAGRSHASWGLCLKLWMLADGQPIQVHGADWRASLCQQMGIGGRDRPTTRALMADLQSDGLMAVNAGFVTVFFHPGQTVEESARGTTGVGEGYDRGTTGVQPGVRQESYPSDLSDRNHSGRILQTDRQTEETERESTRPVAVLNFRQPLGEPPPNLPPAEKPPLEQIVSAHAVRYSQLRQGETCPRDYRAAGTLLAWCEANAAVHKSASGLALALRVVAGLFESERAAEKRWRLSWAATDPAEFLPSPDGCKPVARSKDAAEADKQAAIASQTARLKKEFAASIQAAREADDDYTANKLAAERDLRLSKLQAQAS